MPIGQTGRALASRDVKAGMKVANYASVQSGQFLSEAGKIFLNDRPSDRPRMNGRTNDR